MPSGASAQQFLAIDTIHEDIVVLKDGGLRVILMCSSLNFALKSSEEQDATIFQFQNFLNSLDFPIQFIIHSRRLNITPYLDSLRELHKNQDNELLKTQTSEYIEFIRTFVDMTNIMSKTFYVSVPFTPAIIEQKGFLSTITSTLGIGKKKTDADETRRFDEYKNQLWQRVDATISGLQGFGIRSVPLNTEELIELFYGLYNPTEFEKAAPTKGDR